MRARDYRAAARKQLGGNIFDNKWLMALLLALVYSVLISAASTAFGIGLLIVGGALSYGMAYCFLRQARTDEMDIGDLFKGFSDGGFSRLFVLGLMESIFIFLWTLLFIIPGIVKSYSYSMAYYIANDHPDYEWKQCIDESRKMMDGHKWSLFCLDFSFIGWLIVGALCFGIGTLWVAPYQYAARTQFYLNLVGDKKQSVAESL